MKTYCITAKSGNDGLPLLPQTRKLKTAIWHRAGAPWYWDQVKQEIRTLLYQRGKKQ